VLSEYESTEFNGEMQKHSTTDNATVYIHHHREADFENTGFRLDFPASVVTGGASRLSVQTLSLS
jgi:hypothetical protein